jgi:hypothetical protein
MASKKATGGEPNKSQAIRDLLKENPNRLRFGCRSPGIVVLVHFAILPQSFYSGSACLRRPVE